MTVCKAIIQLSNSCPFFPSIDPSIQPYKQIARKTHKGYRIVSSPTLTFVSSHAAPLLKMTP